MLGAIAGDIIGSAYEWHSTKRTDFDLFTVGSHFTDDTVLTVAVADCILTGKDYSSAFQEYGHRYPNAGYGGRFLGWLASEKSKPYGSYGNGSAMRVSPVGFAFDTIEKVLAEAKRSAEVTHNHSEGIKGAQAVASAIFMARQRESKDKIRRHLEKAFGYDLHQTLAEIRPHYRFDETCQGSVRQSIIAFLESTGYEDAVRKAVSLGGDSDTMVCIAGGIAQAYYGSIPSHISREVRLTLDSDLLSMVDEFNRRFEV